MIDCDTHTLNNICRSTYSCTYSCIFVQPAANFLPQELWLRGRCTENKRGNQQVEYEVTHRGPWQCILNTAVPRLNEHYETQKHFVVTNWARAKMPTEQLRHN